MFGRLATVVALGSGLVALLVGGLGLVGVYGGLTAAGCDGPWGPCSPVIHVPKVLVGAGGLLLARSLVRWSP
ncbi:hypothetical protein [Haloglomus litoreum]|uniref:hypothetical protein n=1 Tax=Haloglomus litoreum TaxID=3034026 RepID=UPI0023E8DC1B|nr:hypothetical protein [Haloglomus sp. DT116]